jgi:hypothetical protein
LYEIEDKREYIHIIPIKLVSCRYIGRDGQTTVTLIIILSILRANGKYAEKESGFFTG